MLHVPGSVPGWCSWGLVGPYTGSVAFLAYLFTDGLLVVSSGYRFCSALLLYVQFALFHVSCALFIGCASPLSTPSLGLLVLCHLVALRCSRLYGMCMG